MQNPPKDPNSQLPDPIAVEVGRSTLAALKQIRNVLVDDTILTPARVLAIANVDQLISVIVRRQARGERDAG